MFQNIKLISSITKNIKSCLKKNAKIANYKENKALQV